MTQELLDLLGKLKDLDNQLQRAKQNRASADNETKRISTAMEELAGVFADELKQLPADFLIALKNEFNG